MESLDSKIDSFLAAPAVAVVGASDDKHKYGHKVLVCYKQNQRKAYPVNPNAHTVLSETCYPDLLTAGKSPLCLDYHTTSGDCQSGR